MRGKTMSANFRKQYLTKKLATKHSLNAYLLMKKFIECSCKTAWNTSRTYKWTIRASWLSKFRMYQRGDIFCNQSKQKGPINIESQQCSRITLPKDARLHQPEGSLTFSN